MRLGKQAKEKIREIVHQDKIAAVTLETLTSNGKWANVAHQTANITLGAV